MLQSHKLAKIAPKTLDKPITKEFGPMHLRSTRSSAAPSPSNLGAGTQCGGALVTEIDSYRRRIQTLIHFFDCIAQHWWDQLYPYKNNYIKRPSKSADEVRSYRYRLLARLNRFTRRTVVPAAAAIATMEAHATVKILPEHLLSQLTAEFASTDIPQPVENVDNLLRKAVGLARRLSDIEKLKQRLILSALTWITSDGRDFSLRAQRVALLIRHAEPCLIEHYDGVRALITHYYRPRVLSDLPDSSKNSTPKAEPITAARLTTTNEQIIQAVRSVCARVHHSWPIETPQSGLDPESERLSPSSRLGFQEDVLANGFSEGRLAGDPLTMLNLFAYDTMEGPTNSKPPILPSIVLNPLAIDTSQLDWLSYEINKKDLNLYVLNMEEPENLDIGGDASLPTSLLRRSSTSKNPTLMSTTSDHSQQEAALAKLPPVQLELRHASSLRRTATTPLTSPLTNGSDWSGASSHVWGLSRVEDLETRVPVQETQVKVMQNESTPTRVEKTEEVDPELTPHDKAHSVESATSEDTSTSLFSIELQSRVGMSSGGAGEGPVKNLLTMDSDSTLKPLQQKKLKKSSKQSPNPKIAHTFPDVKAARKQSSTLSQAISINEKSHEQSSRTMIWTEKNRIGPRPIDN